MPREGIHCFVKIARRLSFSKGRFKIIRMLAVNQDVHSSQVGARSIEMTPFSRQFGEVKFREPPTRVFCNCAWRRKCNAAGARHQSIRRMRPDRPVSVRPSYIDSFSLLLATRPTSRPLLEQLFPSKFSGRFLNGQCAALSVLRSRKISPCIRGKSVPLLRPFHRQLLPVIACSEVEAHKSVRKGHQPPRAALRSRSR